jgi:probable F420-dependent oxidoreductase
MPRPLLMSHNAYMELDAALGHDVQLAAVPGLASRAEELGFSALWTAETRHDPFLPLGLVAEHTQRMGFGTAVAVAFGRSPTVVAHTAWDLARQSDGRFILGLGTQVRAHVRRRLAMPWSGQPVAQIRDYVATVRAVWQAWQNGQPVAHRGAHYSVTLMTPFFSPASIAQPQIPIYLAGVGPAMCALAGEIANGLIVHPLHSRRYLEEVLLPAVAVGAARAGRVPGSICIAASVLVALDEKDRDHVREQIAFSAYTPSYREVLRLHGWEGVAAQLSDLVRRGRWPETPRLVTDAMVDAFAVTSPWEELAERLQERYSGLLDRITLYRDFGAARDEQGWHRLLADLGQG